MRFGEISRAAWVTTAIVFTAWAIVYAHLVPGLVFDWQDGGDFSHGFLVPICTMLLIWSRRASLSRAPRTSTLGGALLLAVGIGMELVGSAASELYLQRTSMLPFLLGWLLLLEGRSRTSILAFPVCFLLFMIPPPTLFWTSLSLPLQLLASGVAESALRLSGIDVVREGNILHLEGCSLEVASACSGIRSLVALLALATLLAEGTLLGLATTRSRLGKVILVFSAVPVAVTVNALRVTLAAFLASSAGKETVDRFHEASGLAMFVVAFAMLFGWKDVLRWIENRSLSRSALS